MTATPDAERDVPLRDGPSRPSGQQTGRPVVRPVVRPEDPWRLADSVSLRPEPFGALAYDFRTRRLSFLKTPTLVDVVRALGEHPSAGEALAAAGVEPHQETSYLHALTTLAASGLIEERA